MLKSFAKKIALRVARDGRRLAGIDQLQASLSAIVYQQGLLALADLKSQDRYRDPKRLLKFGHGGFSQYDEDGIIEEIFLRIGTHSKRFLEVGAGNGWENCTCNLLLQGWSGVWFDAGPLNVKQIKADFSSQLLSGQLQVRDDFIDPLVARSLVQQWPTLQEFDLFCLDIDGNDYHILEAMGVLKPRAVVLEYNSKFRPPIDWVMPYKEGHWWDGTHKYGASLSALCRYMNEGGYSLVGCNITGVNSFFVRNDLLGDKFCTPFTAENHYEPGRYWLSGFATGHPTELPRV